MHIAIYTRKSKYNDKSESTKSQEDFCKNFAKIKYPYENIIFSVYTDEGYSGANTARPQYIQLLKDIKNKTFDILITYKIDRISRSFIDFANLQQFLSKNSVEIISAAEGFDTSSPWGKSVLNILMVFAELERTNVSQRIKDTMTHYAKMGRWTGGLSPTGLKGKIINYKSENGIQKRMAVLTEIPEELKTVKLIYKKYIELKSLSKLCQYINKNGIKTKKGNKFSPSALRDILKNPVYAAADKNTYEYFSKLGCGIYSNISNFNGHFGITVYNRFDKKHIKKQSPKNWIISIGNHKAIIKSENWIETQKILNENSINIPRKGTAKLAAFSGMIYCKNCGSLMRVKNGRINKKTNKKEYYYVCSLKEKSHCTKCEMTNLTGSQFEKQFYTFIKNYLNNYKSTCLKLKNLNITKKNNIKNKEDYYRKEISLKKKSLDNLIIQLSQTADTAAGKYITSHINKLDIEICALENKLKEMSSDSCINNSDFNKILNVFQSIDYLFTLPAEIKNYIFKSIISKFEWDGKNIIIHFADF